jgi:L-fuculose-phosphate aldolase
MKQAILLFAHGARDPAWALPFRAIRDAVAAAAGSPRVELAFLELMTPTLGETAEVLISEGCLDLIVVPLFMAQGGHLKRDLPVLLEDLRARHPGLTIRLTPAIGDVPELTGAIADWVASVALPARLAEQPAREAVLQAARNLNRSGLSHGTSGNVSVRWGDGLLITPSGRAYDALSPKDIVAIDGQGWHSPHQKPSSEWRMHRDLYAQRPEFNAVVHAHPPHCTALAIRGMEIPPLHYMIAVSGGASVRCADYHTYGSEELSRAALAAMSARTCCLLANHGMLAAGHGLDRALWVAEELEVLAQQYILTLQLGGPVLLSEAEIARVVERFRYYGPDAEAPSR